MIIYPILQLQEGRCVSLQRGELDQPTVWHGDPVERALSFVADGAEWLHVTDLDAVAGADDTSINLEIIRQIIRQVGVPVQISGGMRSDETVRTWVDAGAARIVFGSTAVQFRDWVSAKARAYPDLVAVSFDIWQGTVVVDGWSRSVMMTPADLIHAYDGVPLAAMILTDIDRDLDMPESSFALVTKLAEETRTPVIASGLVKALDDVSTLRYMPNLAGAMIGRALYDKSVDLAEAIALARPVPEPVAPFQ
ncbi:MAG: 1-(5-phosphoribosyl)-5-[(5-phosphoribosylamino)methylideneamino] imidazole-4-carboxamide isomerase [Pseudomonadota bacterium]